MPCIVFYCPFYFVRITLHGTISPVGVLVKTRYCKQTHTWLMKLHSEARSLTTWPAVVYGKNKSSIAYIYVFCVGLKWAKFLDTKPPAKSALEQSGYLAIL